MLIHIHDDNTITVENNLPGEDEQITMSREVFDQMLYEVNCWRRLQNELN